MNPRQTADVVIVGAGLMGCSIAYELAKRNGKRIVVLEKKYIGSEATGQSSGVLRSHYSIPILSWMAWESLETFQHAEEILGTSVGYKKVGYLLGVGPENAATLKENVKVMQSIGVDTELISPEQVIEMWPQMQVEKFGGFAFEPQGGYADPYLTAQAYASAARDMGVAIKQQCGVTKLITSEDGSAIVGVETTKNETIYSPCVIVAAGVGSRPVMSTVGIDVQVEGQRAQKSILVNHWGRFPFSAIWYICSIYGLRAADIYCWGVPIILTPNM
jgi:sarcosine oxidase, subunit beta